MKPGNRDLLVMTKNQFNDPTELEHEVELLNEILYEAESIKNFCVANEIIDVNRYKIIRKPHLIIHALREKKNTPFVFVYNKN